MWTNSVEWWGQNLADTWSVIRHQAAFLSQHPLCRTRINTMHKAIFSAALPSCAPMHQFILIVFTSPAYSSRTILPSFIIPDYRHPATPLFIRFLDHWFWKCVLLWAKIVFTISIKTLNTTKDDKKCPFIIWHVLSVAGRCYKSCTRQAGSLYL